MGSFAIRIFRVVALALVLITANYGLATAVGANTVGSITSEFGFSSLSPGLFATQAGATELPPGPMGIGGFTAFSRVYLTFDLSGLNLGAHPSGAATLQLVLSQYTSQGPGGTFPNWTTLSHTSEQFSIFDVSTPYADLQTPFTNACACFPPTPNAAGLAAFADVGSGNLYGTFNASQSILNTPIDVSLSMQAVDDINASGGHFAVGIAFSGVQFQGALGLFGAPLVNQTMSLDQNDSLQQLIITPAPEPESWLFSIMGLASVLVARRAALRHKLRRNRRFMTAA